MTIGGLVPFVPEPHCWICGSGSLRPVGGLIMELGQYREQDPDLAAYSGNRVALNRCDACTFSQPEVLPGLDRYFDRMYDQRWPPEWIRAEFEGRVKDYIFQDILRTLARRLAPARRTLLDVGAHAGRFVALARQAGWRAEGLELNPRTAAYAAERTGARIRQLNVQTVAAAGESYDAVTLTDVLEHIPHPLGVLRTVHGLLSPGGCVSIKVPCGPAQLTKETWRGRLIRGYRPTVADNFVHVSHFSPRSLRLALENTGFTGIRIAPAAPELPDARTPAGLASRAVRLGLYMAARTLPGGLHTPLALNLQAFAHRPALRP